MAEATEIEGLVVRTTGSWYDVLEADGQRRPCRLRGNYRLKGSKQTNPIAVGDRVRYVVLEDGTGMIGSIGERRNCIIRRATKLSKQTHVIAANVDLLCVVATLGMPRTSTGFIDRMLATAEAYGIKAMVVMNKCDLYDEALWALHGEVASIYRQAGYEVLEVSALTGMGVEELRKRVDGKVCLFSGHSGVGKSALLNALEPRLGLKVGEVSEWSMKGTHTTTFAEIFPLGNTYVIDTPGIKEFGLVGIPAQELSHFFPEMRARLSGCHFANCTHRHEPGCAVKAAVEAGEISAERYGNYLNMVESM